MRIPSTLRPPPTARHAGLLALLAIAACRDDAGPLAVSPAVPDAPSFVVAGASMIELGTFPGGGILNATAINDAGHVVGVGYLGNVAHAALWTPQDGLQDIDALLDDPYPAGAHSLALDNNNAGQILYRRWGHQGLAYYLWTPGPSGTGTSVEVPSWEPRAINNAGQVMSISSVWTPPASGTGGTIRNLDRLGYGSVQASDINDAGEVAGYVAGGGHLRAVVWQPDGSGTILSGLGGTKSAAVGINDAGWVSGWSTTASDADYRAVIWSPAGVIQDLGIDVDGAQGFDITEDGVVLVGAAGLASIWTAADGERDLRPVGTSIAFAIDINNAGQVVGGVEGPLNETGGTRPVLWGSALNVAPVARIGGPYAAMVGAAIPFDASGSSDANLDALAFAWDFDGNGTTDATGPSPQHAYAAAGEYTARLVVSDPGGRADTATAAVSVGATVAGIALNGPYVGLEGSPVLLTSAGSETADGGVPKWYRWDFGDGTRASSVYQTTPFNWSKRYSEDGTYVVTLTVASKTGTVRVARTTVTVTNVAPGATLTGPSSAREGSAPVFVFSGATDPGAADRAAGYAYSLDCGSGYFGAWQASPTLVCPAIPDEDLNPRQVRARVRDKDGGVSEYLRSLTVTGRPPVVEILSASRSGSTATITFRFTDPGAYDAPWRHRVYWGDGSPSPQTVVHVQGTTITATHTYTGPITSPVFVAVSDKDSRGGRSPDITF